MNFLNLQNQLILILKSPKDLEDRKLINYARVEVNLRCCIQSNDFELHYNFSKKLIM